MNWLEEVKEIFAGYGIPTYIWRAIMLLESGGKPDAHNNSGTEDSRGLFQINLKANPAYKDLDLFDPVINAMVAARDFIWPAYQEARARGIKDPEELAVYVWRHGIRPFWTDAKEKAIRRLVRKLLGMDGDGRSD